MRSILNAGMSAGLYLVLVFLTFGEAYRVLLRDVQVLTLYDGQVTTGRRSSPVPQLRCVGGTAGCSAFVPKVVQCKNQGSDGIDFQWDCKTDMDNAYRFGRISVSCEGYDYPDDPFILQGSCGLEYTIDLTKEGSAQNSGYSGYSGQSSNYVDQSSKTSSGGMFMLVVIIIIVGAGYFFIKSVQPQGAHQNPGYDQNYGFGSAAPPPSYPGPPPPGFTAPPPSYSAPPPPGFRPEYMPGDGGCGSYASGTHQSRNNGQGGLGGGGLGGGGLGGGGFWTGAATGGVLGYLFGSRNNAQPSYGSHSFGSPSYSGHSQYHAPGNSGSSWFSGSSTTATRRPESSSGTRTASGFGGTTRR